jgi:hypothetical protein
MSFTAVEHIDVWALASSLRSKQLHGAAPSVAIKDGDRYQPFVKEWAAMVKLLKLLRELSTAREWETRSISLIRLRTTETTEWLPSDLAWGEAVLPIVTNPMTFVFAGRVSQHIEAGVLTLVDGSLPGCAVNWGKTPHYHLAIECRPTQQKEAEE